MWFQLEKINFSRLQSSRVVCSRSYRDHVTSERAMKYEWCPIPRELFVVLNGRSGGKTGVKFFFLSEHFRSLPSPASFREWQEKFKEIVVLKQEQIHADIWHFPHVITSSLELVMLFVILIPCFPLIAQATGTAMFNSFILAVFRIFVWMKNYDIANSLEGLERITPTER